MVQGKRTFYNLFNTPFANVSGVVLLLKVRAGSYSGEVLVSLLSTGCLRPVNLNVPARYTGAPLRASYCVHLAVFNSIHPSKTAAETASVMRC